ncbi:MASE4 domain-containing protein [Bradyrhizobium sp. DASA03120]|uniref:MASE4 domain-containing protein n=1 Tax=Bradyrhizobium sp. SMVTL-02 TaxID=3395917 RepID=UPI003F717C36
MPNSLKGGHFDPAAVVRDFPPAIATVPATAQQRRAAISVVIALIVVTAVVAPFANRTLGRVDAFVPVLQTVLATADLITAILLLAQYVILPQRALLAVAAAYLCSASFAFLQTLSFPGGYAPTGLIGDGTNTSAWFFVFWHLTYPLGILIYAFSKDAPVRSMQLDRPGEAAIGVTIVSVFVVVAGLAWLATAGLGSLPVFYRDSVTLQTRLGNQVNLGLLLWYAIVLVVLLVRKRTILDIWLAVILMAWMPNFVVAMLASSVRFSLGWYASRGFALFASFVLLSVLLTEMTVLYSRLANAFSLLRRERTNRLMSVDAATSAIAHEVRSPLGAIALNADAALAQLRSTPPGLAEVGVILSDIEADALRVNEVLSGIRALFKREPGNRVVPVHLEALIRHAVTLSEHDLLASGTAVSTDFRGGRTIVRADPIQLQQVVLNLIRNSIDAMANTAPDNRQVTISMEADNGSTVVLSVSDSGTGIAKEDQDRIFDAFFTEKAAGMGLGLAISRAIVEGHGGTLRLVKSDPKGSVFEIELPTDRG